MRGVYPLELPETVGDAKLTAKVENDMHCALSLLGWEPLGGGGYC